MQVFMIGTLSFLHHPKISRQLSAGKIMASEFLDSEGVIHIDFLPHSVTINTQCYNLLRSDVHQAIRKKRRGKLSKKIIALHDNARPRTVDLTKATFATVGLGNHEPPSIQAWLSPQ
jgi:hypothetical protein